MLIFFGESDTIKTMKLFDIHKIPDPVLFQKAQEVSMPLSEEKRQLILDMVEYLKISQDDDLAKKYHIRPGFLHSSLSLQRSYHPHNIL